MFGAFKSLKRDEHIFDDFRIHFKICNTSIRNEKKNAFFSRQKEIW